MQVLESVQLAVSRVPTVQFKKSRLLKSSHFRQRVRIYDYLPNEKTEVPQPLPIVRTAASEPSSS